MKTNSELASESSETSSETVIQWILRVGVAGCFIGHGAFGIITKSGWLPYFAVAGIGEETGWALMPWVGTMDIAMGILALVWPSRALLVWCAVWATWTAMLRPLAGEPFWEFLERAGNYGVPLSILLLLGLKGSWFGKLPSRWEITENNREALMWGLRVTTIVLLVGHAGLGLFTQKAGLAHHYSVFGLEDPARWVPIVGAFEFALAALAMVFFRPEIFAGICIWKIGTESLFYFSGAPFWEVIERFGSYAAPLALAVLIWQKRRNSQYELQPATA